MSNKGAENCRFEGLTRKQANAMPFLVNPKYKTYEEVAEAADVSERAIYKWLNDEKFVEALNREVEKYTDGETARVWKALVREAADGDVSAIKLFFELKNKYRDRKEITGKDGGAIEIEESAKKKIQSRIDSIAERTTEE